MADLTLTDEQKDLRELAHSFAEKDMRKVAWDYDKDGTWPQDIVDKGTPAGTPHRRALAIAGDDADAKAQVARFIDEIGFDVVDLGPLAEGWRIQRDTPGYGTPDDAEQLRAHTAAAKRYRDM